MILFIFGYPLLFSWWSMLVIPITLFVYGLLRRWQDRNVFRVLHARPEPDRRGFWGYLLGYQVLTSAASLRGYAQQSWEPRGAGRMSDDWRVLRRRSADYRGDGLSHADTRRPACSRSSSSRA